MGARSLILLALAACGGGAATNSPATPSVGAVTPSLRDKVVADFEAAVKTSREAYVALFDFVAVGEYLSCGNDDCKNQLPNFRLSPGVTIDIVADNGDQPNFIGRASAFGGTKTFTYNSAAGGMR